MGHSPATPWPVQDHRDSWVLCAPGHGEMIKLQFLRAALIGESVLTGWKFTRSHMFMLNLEAVRYHLNKSGEE